MLRSPFEQLDFGHVPHSYFVALLSSHLSSLDFGDCVRIGVVRRFDSSFLLFDQHLISWHNLLENCSLLKIKHLLPLSPCLLVHGLGLLMHLPLGHLPQTGHLGPQPPPKHQLSRSLTSAGVRCVPVVEQPPPHLHLWVPASRHGRVHSLDQHTHEPLSNRVSFWVLRSARPQLKPSLLGILPPAG